MAAQSVAAVCTNGATQHGRLLCGVHQPGIEGAGCSERMPVRLAHQVVAVSVDSGMLTMQVPDRRASRAGQPQGHAAPQVFWHALHSDCD